MSENELKAEIKDLEKKIENLKKKIENLKKKMISIIIICAVFALMVSVALGFSIGFWGKNICNEFSTCAIICSCVVTCCALICATILCVHAFKTQRTCIDAETQNDSTKILMQAYKDTFDKNNA